MRITLILLIQVLSFSMSAHQGGHDTPSQIWKLNGSNEIIQADFIKHEDGTVFLSSHNHTIITLPISEFEDRDQQYILNKSTWIHVLQFQNNCKCAICYMYNPNEQVTSQREIVPWTELF